MFGITTFFNIKPKNKILFFTRLPGQPQHLLLSLYLMMCWPLLLFFFLCCSSAALSTFPFPSISNKVTGTNQCSQDQCSCFLGCVANALFVIQSVMICANTGKQMAQIDKLHSGIFAYIFPGHKDLILSRDSPLYFTRGT